MTQRALAPRRPSITSRSLARAGFLALAALGAGSCVTQQEYDEALETTKLYQRMVHDLEQYQGTLEAEVEALRARQALGGEPIESGFTEELDERMAELQRMEERIAGLSPDGEVSLVTFDGGFGYRLDSSVLFDSGSQAVSAGGRSVLDSLAREIEARPYTRIWVRGHTDSDPIVRPQTKERFPHGNLQLSAARAVAVGALLIDEGKLPAGDVVIAGYGQWEPVAPNDNADNKRLNRRVEIFVANPE